MEQNPGKSMARRYGIGEWYGRSISTLSPNERIELSTITTTKSRPCIPRAYDVNNNLCTKRDGVCSLRVYERSVNGDTRLLGASSVVTLCLHRLKEDGDIFHWVGELILNTTAPKIVTEVVFLMREGREFPLVADPLTRVQPQVAQDESEDVGQIDYVLLGERSDPLDWCALELQAVYFSGAAIGRDVQAVRSTFGDDLVFPVGIRRPDYRSSGPKRLMPQLQIKVPTLRRWGKKMAVVVDKNFFKALGKMERASDISNCDIAWFVVDYLESENGLQLQRDDVVFTTLEHAVEGLTAGKPVSLTVFEDRIKQKLARSKARPKR